MEDLAQLRPQAALEAAAVYGKALVGHVSSGVRAEIDNRLGDVLRLTDEAERRVLLCILDALHATQALHQQLAQLRVDQAGRDDVDADAVLPLLLRQRVSQGLHAGLRYV